MTKAMARRWLLVAALAGGAVAPPATHAQVRAGVAPAARQPDVARIRLGLSPEQTMAALRAFNPQVRIRVVEETFRGATFVSTMFGGAFGNDRQGTGDDLSRLQFSNPPDSRLVLIGRQQRFPAGHELTVGQVFAAFEQKYGPPLYKGGAAILTNLGRAAGLPGQPAPSQPICQGAAAAGVSLSGNV